MALVVPSKIGLEIPTKRGVALRNYKPARGLVPHGPEESFDYCDASVLPDRAAMAWFTCSTRRIAGRQEHQEATCTNQISPA